MKDLNDQNFGLVIAFLLPGSFCSTASPTLRARSPPGSPRQPAMIL